jgi:asparagine synthase (glutamine-hydrolysing)
MCGISGYLDVRYDEVTGRRLLMSMNQKLHHRGPDGSGIWTDTDSGVGLGHTRLSIVGHGEAGAQPMISQSGRYVLTFNGEIYNFRELRILLEDCNYPFRGSSDTEVLLGSIETWGLDEALPRFEGMFGFALFDKKVQELFLVRDRLGEKPLYFGWGDHGHIGFSSDLRGLMYLVDGAPSISRRSLANLIGYSYIASPFSIFSRIDKVRPGSLVRFKRSEKQWTRVAIDSWWQIDSKTSRTCWVPGTSKNKTKLKLLEVLEEVIDQQGNADVPVGAFLSGGVDSTLVTAIHQKNRRESIKTFTIAFSEVEFNEGRHASLVAEKIGTDHKEFILTPDEALEVIQTIPQAYGEPFADSSQVATLAVCRAAAQTVSAALTGDGGDEVFGGYNRYVWAPRIWSFRESCPDLLLKVARFMLEKPSPGSWRVLQKYISSVGGITQFADKMHKVAWALSASTKTELFRGLISHHRLLGAVIGGQPDDVGNSYRSVLEGPDPFGRAMMQVDLLTYLPEDILVKLDRASMSVGLEARAPLIDIRIIDFMRKVPTDYLFEARQGKTLLREALKMYLPIKLIERPKAGFAVPIGEWLRGPLQGWADALLTKDRLLAEGLFDADLVRNFWKEHLRGKIDCHQSLWPVLMFQAWYESYEVSASAVQP